MVYRRNRRRAYKPKTTGGGFLSKAGKALAVAGTALSVAKGVAALVNTEFKYVDYPTTAFSVLDSLTSYGMTQLNRGTGPESRNGDSIKCKMLGIHGHLNHNSAGDEVQAVRLMILRYNDCNGAGPVEADLLSESHPYAWREIDTSGRYTVLWDKIVTLTSEHPTYKFCHCKDYNSHVKYIGSTSALTDCGKGNLFFVALSSQATANYPTCTFSTRVRFIDN